MNPLPDQSRDVCEYGGTGRNTKRMKLHATNRDRCSALFLSCAALCGALEASSPCPGRASGEREAAARHGGRDDDEHRGWVALHGRPSRRRAFAAQSMGRPLLDFRFLIDRPRGSCSRPKIDRCDEIHPLRGSNESIYRMFVPLFRSRPTFRPQEAEAPAGRLLFLRTRAIQIM